MNLIGCVRYIESRLYGRKSNQGRGRPAKKDGETKASADAGSFSPDSRLGQKIDTTA
ncbi:MAG: hypothetical protein WC216_06945 [Gallionella sp.]|jgi:hypothetical protein